MIHKITELSLAFVCIYNNNTGRTLCKSTITFWHLHNALVSLKCMIALVYVCLLTLRSEPAKCYHILNRTDWGSWSTTVLSSHSHIQITNYVYKPLPECTMGPDRICIPSLSLLLSCYHPAFLCLSSSPPCPPMPIMSLFLSPQSDQELILWILTLIQWDSYNPLSDYGATHTHTYTHIQTHTCTNKPDKYHLNV